MSNQRSEQPTRHKIGSARTIQTAVLVVAYLERAHPKFNDGRTRYVFTDPTDKNGWWSADIIVDVWEKDFDARREREISEMVGECRAFVAGRGEVWA